MGSQNLNTMIEDESRTVRSDIT